MAISSHLQALKPNIGVASLALLLTLASGHGSLASAAIPSSEKLLPDDTLLVLTTPDFTRLREIYKKSPPCQLWNDPAMKLFKDKFMSKWRDEFVKPLERELDVPFDDYLPLLQGQATLAVTQNGWQGREDSPPAFLLLLDTRDKSGQLKTNLARLHQKWLDSGKTVRTEKLRNLEFFVLGMSSNDAPKTLKKFLPQKLEVQELGAEAEPKKPAVKNELVLGQVDSLLIVGNSLKAVENVLGRLTGGASPALADLAAYEANHRALFRDAPLYGWVNVKAFVDVLGRKPLERKESDAPDPFSLIKADKLIAASGLAGVKAFAFSFRDSSEGWLLQFFLAAPEATRQGLLKILAAGPKNSEPPPFIPADAVKFRRWRVDGQKGWATLEKVLGDLSPKVLETLNLILEAASDAAKAKDPGFDARKALFGNIGDDMISYEKAPPRGSSLADVRSAPSLMLLASPKPDQFVAALKGIVGFMNQGGNPSEREFLGRKILSMPLPGLPLPIADSAKPAAPRTLNFAAASSFVAMSTDVSLLEEYLRSGDSQAKTLRETPGLLDAAQKVGGTGTGFFGYENYAETARATFEALKQDPRSATNSAASGFLPGALGFTVPQTEFAQLLDFSLLPAFDKVSRYFGFTVYAASTTVDGLSLKVFAPTPQALK